MKGAGPSLVRTVQPHQLEHVRDLSCRHGRRHADQREACSCRRSREVSPSSTHRDEGNETRDPARDLPWTWCSVFRRLRTVASAWRPNSARAPAAARARAPSRTNGVPPLPTVDRRAPPRCVRPYSPLCVASELRRCRSDVGWFGRDVEVID